MAKNITEGNSYTNAVVMPEDGIDARTAASLYPATESLASRANWLKAELAARTTELAAANGRITTLEQTVQRLTTHTAHEHNSPGTTYTLPANTDISVLKVHFGVGGVDGVVGDEPRTEVILNQPQSEGKVLAIYGIIPDTTTPKGVGLAVLNPIFAEDLSNNSTYLTIDRYNRYISLIYVAGQWYPTSDPQKIAYATMDTY